VARRIAGCIAGGHCGALLVAFLFSQAPSAAAAEEPAKQPLTDASLEAWLATDPADPDTKPDRAELEAPPPPPRRHGVVIEGSVGALGHLGDMKHVSPVAPWFRLQAGYEIFDWLMAFGQGDVALANTSYAHRPPDNRSYALFGFGVGARASWQPLSALGFYLQGEAGLGSVDEDVLSTYGYRYAGQLRPYFGGTIGVEWFQINPHYGLALYGGARDYVQTFERTYGSNPPIVWVSGLALRYTL
jgi:hypothetical protein